MMYLCCVFVNIHFDIVSEMSELADDENELTVGLAFSHTIHCIDIDVYVISIVLTLFRFIFDSRRRNLFGGHCVQSSYRFCKNFHENRCLHSQRTSDTRSWTCVYRCSDI